MFKVSTLKIDLEQTKTGSSTLGAVDGGTGNGGIWTGEYGRGKWTGEREAGENVLNIKENFVFL